MEKKRKKDGELSQNASTVKNKSLNKYIFILPLFLPCQFFSQGARSLQMMLKTKNKVGLAFKHSGSFNDG